jgi:HECT-domain (ubiquitin-transferase)
MFIAAGETQVSFEEILQFVSGADQIPVLGFDKQATIDFYTPVSNVRRLPYASTCDIRLFLPRGVQCEELSSMLQQSMLESHGFGFV